jgi:hypothetical protein
MCVIPRSYSSLKQHASMVNPDETPHPMTGVGGVQQLMVTRAIQGLGSIAPSYSSLWATVDTSARPVTILDHTEVCGSRPEWLGVAWPP